MFGCAIDGLDVGAIVGLDFGAIDGQRDGGAIAVSRWRWRRLDVGGGQCDGLRDGDGDGAMGSAMAARWRRDGGV